jgi:hypothetical protein
MILDPGLIAGAVVISGSLFGLVGWRKYRVKAGGNHAWLLSELRAELQSQMQAMLLAHQVEYSEQIAQLGRNVAALEQSAQNVDEVRTGGLSRSARSQAMQLLRSGMSPESAASALRIGKREMRLIATVSSTLSLK